MEKIRYAIIGSGWRALYYIRIAQALPEQFEVTGMLVRTEEKKQKMTEEYGIATTTDRAELLAAKPDFVVSAVSRINNCSVILELMKEGIPVLAETPPADTLEDLLEIWKTKEKYPFPTNVLPEDETAIARLLVGMKKYLETGEELYPLADAMQDAYLTSLLKESAATGNTVTSRTQVWAN